LLLLHLFSIIEIYEMAENQTVEEQCWEPGKILLDNYVVKDVLGQGGMGRVYLVERSVSHGTIEFAVKTLLSTQMEDDTEQKVFLRELQTWMDLPEHPNVTCCRFARTIEGRLTIFSEYVSGNSLGHWIQSGKLQTLDKILDVAIQSA